MQHKIFSESGQGSLTHYISRRSGAHCHKKCRYHNIECTMTWQQLMCSVTKMWQLSVARCSRRPNKEIHIEHPKVEVTAAEQAFDTWIQRCSDSRAYLATPIYPELEAPLKHELLLRCRMARYICLSCHALHLLCSCFTISAALFYHIQ